MKRSVVSRSLLVSMLLLVSAAAAGAISTDAAADRAVSGLEESAARFSPAGGQGRFSAANEHGQFRYLIEFAEAGLLRQQAGRAPGQRFDINAPGMRALQQQLQTRQAVHRQAMESAVGRSLEITHHYLVSHSGMALWLAAGEAETIARLDGVVSVERERLYELDTYRGPEFIGADAIWDGNAVPGGSELRGEDLAIAVLDTGVAPTHPSFANVAACGHGEGGNPDKLISFLDCATTDGTGLCNGPSPVDTNGHGSHTASTAGGNVVDGSASPPANPPPPFTEISGVAPCAYIRSYKVCPTNNCPDAQIQAGMDSVLLQQSDGPIPIVSMNFSISGGLSPWNDNDRKKLDLVDAGIFVAASAGNTSTAIPDPVGNVGHRGPWVMSVANISHDVISANSLSLDGGPTDEGSVQGTGPALGADYNGQLRWAGDADPGNETGCAAFPGGAFTGEAALIIRGDCDFSVKVNNAVAAGANFVVVFNNLGGPPIVMGALGGTPVPSVMVTNSVGNDLVTALGGGTAELTVLAAVAAFQDPDFGDVLSGGSLIGPTPAPLQHLQKPDIAAPGTSILAAVPGGYAFISGTSMSSPHVAGAATLMRQAQPAWTVSEIKSALQMTSIGEGKKANGDTPWDADDVGHGRTDLSKAALAGLVIDETTANYLEANPSGGTVDVRDLNLAAVRNVDCTPDCTWTRTVRNTLSNSATWNITGTAISGDFDIDISPNTLNFTGGLAETEDITITVTPNEVLTDAVYFGEVVLTETGSLSPDLHITVAIRGGPFVAPAIEVAPDSIETEVPIGGMTTEILAISNIGDPGSMLEYTITEGDPTPAVLELSASGSAEGGGMPIELVVDGFDGAIGGVGVGAQSFLWFNRFTPGPLDLPFTLEEVEVIEVPGFFDLMPGDVYDVYVWSSPDGDPTSGNEVLLTSVTGETLGAVPAFVTIPLPGGGVEIDASTGDVLIGIVNRTPREGSSPAVSDSGFPSAGRSWVAFNFPAAPGDPPDLSAAGTIGVIDDFVAGRNWIIRGFGTGGNTACDSPAGVPWLDVDPDTGTVDSGDSDEITVTIDAGTLDEGTHIAILCIESNDPDQPLVAVQVKVEVAGEPPEIGVDPASLSSTLPSGGSEVQDLTISNLGDSDLDWSILDGSGAEVWSDDFDSYVNGSQIHGQGGWFGWLDDPALGAFVSDEQARSAPHSLEIEGNNDPVRPFEDVDSGSVVVTAWQFIPDGFSGTTFFIMQNTYNHAGTGLNWSTQVNFDSTTNLVTNTGVTGGTLPMITGEWVEIRVEIDFDADTQTFYYGGDELYNGTWTEEVSGGGALNLGAINLFANNASPVYYDDISVTTGLPEGCDAPSELDWLDAAPLSGTTAPADSTVVDVTFDASSLSNGDFEEAVLCISSNDPSTPMVMVPVDLTVGEPGVLAIDPTELDFGDVEVGDSAGAMFTVSNAAAPGSASIELDALNLTADPEFAITGGDCDPGVTELAPGESCTVDVTFSPQAVDLFSGQIEVVTADAQSETVDLVGAGIDLDPPELVVDPLSHDFGEVTVNGSATLTVLVTNAAAEGAADLELTQVALIAGAPQFGIDASSTCAASTMLAPEDSCTVVVEFAPNALAAFSGVLRVSGDGQSEDVELTGEGVEPEEDIFADRFEEL